MCFPRLRNMSVKGTAARMEQLCVHALLVQLYARHLVAEGQIPPAASSRGFAAAAKGSAASAEDVRPPVWLGKDYQLQRQPAGTTGCTGSGTGAVGSAATGAPSRRWRHRQGRHWNGWSRSC